MFYHKYTCYNTFFAFDCILMPIFLIRFIFPFMEIYFFTNKKLKIIIIFMWSFHIFFVFLVIFNFQAYFRLPSNFYALKCIPLRITLVYIVSWVSVAVLCGFPSLCIPPHLHFTSFVRSRKPCTPFSFSRSLFFSSCPFPTCFPASLSYSSLLWFLIKDLEVIERVYCIFGWFIVFFSGGIG